MAVDTENLESKVLGLSNSTGLAAAEINEALYSALSAGIPVTEDMAEATGFLESAAKLAKAGFTDIDTAIAATAKTLNAYGMDVSEADRINKVLIQTQNKGITTVGELGASLAQVTPTAAAFGVSFEQVGASLAGMTAAGTPTAQATTQLNSLIAELGKNGTTAAKNLMKAAEGTEYAGMSFTEMMAAGADLSDVLGLIQAEADKSGLSMVDMFSSIEAGKAALSIFSSDFAGNMEAMGTSVDVVGEAYEKMSDTFETKSAMAKEGVTNLGIAIYGSFKDSAKGALDIVNDYIAQLTAAFEQDGATGLIQAAGNVISDVVTRAVEYAPKMIDLAITLIQSLLDGIQQNLPQIINGAIAITESLIDGIVQMLPQLVEMGIQIIVMLALGIATMLPSLVPTIVDVILKICEVLINNLDTIIDAAIAIIIALAQGLIDALPILIEKAPYLINKLVGALIELAPDLAKAALKLIVELGKGLIKSIAVLLENVPQIVEALYNALMCGFEVVKEIGAYIIEGIWQGISDGYDWICGKIREWVGNVIGYIKKKLGINSPSKVMRDQVGKYMAQGVVVGFDEEDPVGTIDKSLKHSWAGLQTNFKATAQQYGSGVNYKKLGNAVADSMMRSGLTVQIDNRELGRIVRKVVPV